MKRSKIVTPNARRVSGCDANGSIEKMAGGREMQRSKLRVLVTLRMRGISQFLESIFDFDSDFESAFCSQLSSYGYGLAVIVYNDSQVPITSLYKCTNPFTLRSQS